MRDPASEADGLTPRERDVLRLANAGRTNRQIADELGITRNAVRFHLKDIHSKLQTDGERSRLTAGWRKALGLIAFPAAKFGSTATAAALVGGVALSGFAAYQAYAGDSAQADEPPLVDGLYPNGCPPEFNAGTMTLADFAHGQTTLDELRALNPGLSEGWLPPETIVKVPYDPTKTCAMANMTPAGSTPAADGTPQPRGTPKGAAAIAPTPVDYLLRLIRRPDIRQLTVVSAEVPVVSEEWWTNILGPEDEHGAGTPTPTP